MNEITIWSEGSEESITRDEFLLRANSGRLPKGSLVKWSHSTKYTDPTEFMDGIAESPPLIDDRVQEQKSHLLMRCAACEREVSKAAQNCPTYGHPIAAASHQGHGGNVIAAIASLLFPRLGQLAQGRLLLGLGLFMVCCFAWIVLLGWIVHFGAAVEAAVWRPSE